MNLESNSQNSHTDKSPEITNHYWEEIEKNQSKIRKQAAMYLFQKTPDPILRQSEDDVANEVLLKIHQNIDKYNPSLGGIMTWAETITRNHVVDYIRRNSQQRSGRIGQTLHQEDLEGFNPKSEALNPEEILIKNEKNQTLKNALSKLKEEEKEIIILRDIQGLSYDEISEKLKIPINTVKSRLNRARLKLATKFGKHEKINFQNKI